MEQHGWIDQAKDLIVWIKSLVVNMGTYIPWNRVDIICFKKRYSSYIDEYFIQFYISIELLYRLW